MRRSLPKGSRCPSRSCWRTATNPSLYAHASCWVGCEAAPRGESWSRCSTRRAVRSMREGSRRSGSRCSAPNGCVGRNIPIQPPRHDCLATAVSCPERAAIGPGQLPRSLRVPAESVSLKGMARGRSSAWWNALRCRGNAGNC